MDVPANVFILGMLHRIVLMSECVQVVVAAMFIGCQQLNLVADGLADETIQGGRIGVLDHLTDQLPFRLMAQIAVVFPLMREMCCFLSQWRFWSLPPMPVSLTSTSPMSLSHV